MNNTDAPRLSRHQTTTHQHSHGLRRTPISVAPALLLLSASLTCAQNPTIHPLGDIPLPAAEYARQALAYPAEAVELLPASYDARNQGIVTPAKNQGTCGSCWAFNAVGAMESHLLARSAVSPADLSEQQQVSCNTSRSGCVGGSMSSIRFWETTRPVVESCFPYTGRDTTTCLTSCSAVEYRVVNWHTVNATVGDFKTSCYTEGKLLAIHRVFRLRHVLEQRHSRPSVSEHERIASRGHAVLLIGWDDAKGAFLCKNSWGQSGGPNGDGTFWIAYNNHANNLGFGMATFHLVYVGNPAVPLGDALDAPSMSWTTSGDASWYGQTQISHDGQDAGASGTIGHLGETWVQTTFTGPGTVSFWWKVSSEAGWDYLRALVDGAEQARISGETGWEQRSVPITVGVHTLRWKYDKDGTGSVGADRGWLDQVSFTPTPQAEIAVSSGTAQIVDGQGTAIDFGRVIQGLTGPTRTFVVRNIGGQTLTLGTVSVPSGFVVIDALVSSLAPGAQDNLTVQLESTSVGTKTGRISIPNNDSDENPFDFPTIGVVAPRPTLVYVDGDSTCPNPNGTQACPYRTFCEGYDTIAAAGTVRMHVGSCTSCRSLLTDAAILESYQGSVTLYGPGAGSDPLAGGSVVTLAPPVRRPDGSFTMSFTAAGGQRYQVLSRPRTL